MEDTSVKQYQALNISASPGFAPQQAAEAERKGWTEATYAAKNTMKNKNNHYDWSRRHLNFEIKRGSKMTIQSGGRTYNFIQAPSIVSLGTQPLSLSERYEKRLKELGYEAFKVGAKNQPNTLVDFVINGDHERMTEIAFGKPMDFDWREDNSAVTLADDPKRPGRKQIVSMALDYYGFFCRKFGEENVIGFECHLDETGPHFHAHVIPVAEKKVQGRGGSSYDLIEGSDVDGKKRRKHIYKRDYERLSEEEKKFYQLSDRKTVVTVNYAHYFGKTHAEALSSYKQLHTELYEAVSKKWGLERGEDTSLMTPEERNKHRKKSKRQLERERQQLLKENEKLTKENASKIEEGRRLDEANAGKEAKGRQLDAANAEKDKAIAEKKMIFEKTEKDANTAYEKLDNTMAQIEKAEGTLKGQETKIGENNGILQQQQDEIAAGKEELQRIDLLKKENSELPRIVTEKKNAALQRLVDDVAPGFLEVGELLTDPNLQNDDLTDEQKTWISGILNSNPAQRIREAVALLRYGRTFDDGQSRYTQMEVVTAAMEKPLQGLKSQGIDFVGMAEAAGISAATRVATVALCLLLGNGEAAAMASGGGGGGSSPLAGWDGRRKDENDRDFAGRCFWQACRACGISAGTARQSGVRHRRGWTNIK